eukprot:735929-Hanusia_phi.AAC.1
MAALQPLLQRYSLGCPSGPRAGGRVPYRPRHRGWTTPGRYRRHEAPGPMVGAGRTRPGRDRIRVTLLPAESPPGES